MPDHIFLYGPPGSGKSTLGKALAAKLALPFVDLDAEVEQKSGRPIRTIFSQEGEAGFRIRESEKLRSVIEASAEAVIALGGGALLDPANRSLAEQTGTILFLETPLNVLQARTLTQPGVRPLLTGGGKAAPTPLAELLEHRAEHYASFPWRIDGGKESLAEKVELAQLVLGAFQIRGMGRQETKVRVGKGLLPSLGERFRDAGWRDDCAVIADTNTAKPYAEVVVKALHQAGISATLITIPAGETYKHIDTVITLWQSLMAAGIDRSGTVVAVGGGVVGDLAGFASATWMRGVRWVGVPTTLLAMVDSSLGGKTAFDLPEGKNLVGAFHPPAMVLADTDTLQTLPPDELRCGLAEAIKHGVIGDPALFAQFEARTDWGHASAWTPAAVARAMAVKMRIIQEDPYERGVRAALNLGHTIGHAVELASDFTLRHGEAVAIGMVAEARLSERLGAAQESGLSERLIRVLTKLGLPTEIPAHLDREIMRQTMRLDKKNEAGLTRFALPIQIGEIQTRVAVDPDLALE